MEIQEQLRIEHRKMGAAVPLMTQAADTIDRLQAEIGPLQGRIKELERALQQVHSISEGTLRLGNK